MRRQFDLSEAITIIEQGFLPLTCMVELFDKNRQFRFRVFNKTGQRVLTASKALTNRARTRDGLRYMVLRARNSIEKKGLHLQPWHMPS